MSRSNLKFMIKNRFIWCVYVKIWSMLYFLSAIFGNKAKKRLEKLEYCIINRNYSFKRSAHIKLWTILYLFADFFGDKTKKRLEKLEYCIIRRDYTPVLLFVSQRLNYVNNNTFDFLCRIFPFLSKNKTLPCVPLRKGEPLISVIIPCFNYGCYVKDAIESVLAQTIENLEIIVVEGGSTDGSTRAALEQLRLPRTRVIYQDCPTLVGENRNTGIREAKGRYICCLDADDILLPTYLEKAIYILETFNYDIVSTQYETFGAKKEVYSICPFPTLSEMLQGNHVMTCAVFKRAAWRQTAAGFVDTGTGAAHLAEDWRFWIELALQGARIRNITNECLLMYRVYSDGSSLSTKDGVLSPELQRQKIIKLFGSQLNQSALQNSRRLSRLRYICETFGGALSCSVQIKTAPTILVCMGLIIDGGAERLLSTVVGHLSSRGWRAIVVSTVDDLTENSHPISWFTAHTPEVYQLQRFLVNDNERAGFIRYLVASRKVDIVLQAGSVLLYRILKQIRFDALCISVVDLLFNTSPEGHIASNRKFRSCIDHIITENSEVERWLLSHGEDSSSVTVIPSGVEKSQVAFNDVKTLRLELGIPIGSVVFGFSGRLSPEKNPLCFIELASRCSDLDCVYFVMTGGGPLADVIDARIRDLGLTRLIYMGFVDKPRNYLAMYDALLLPSIHDGRPLAVMEAMMLGTPCFASRVGGLPEMIQDNVTGILVAPGDVDEFECAVRKAVADLGSLRKLGRAAAEFARVHFDLSAMCLNYEKTLQRIIASQRIKG